MLSNVLILHQQSGLVLFSKDFVKNGVAQPRLLGSLLTAMTEFSDQCTGMKPTLIEMSSLAVTLVHDEGVKLLCALVHDRNDSASFGRLIASEILTAFVDDYTAEKLRTPSGLQDFHGFDAKIHGIVQNAVRPVLEKLQAHRGVFQALLVTEESIVQAGVEVDQFAVLANLHVMLPYADHILDFAHDALTHVFFDDDLKTSRTFFWRIDRCVLVVCFSLALGNLVYADALDHATQSRDLISQVIAFAQASYRPPVRRHRSKSSTKPSKSGGGQDS